ncbi:Secreted protein [Parendozoicomonas haliclonae]|uniref:Uncharacterized protein n=1 Tax=Parendozoicomonas haliclonae TaxID=1960125 RepID=A0A1X7AQN5_9GAMM|nr:hypothetical protein EHSB41UT_04197 [Parendozoicomonas haliclonae]
MEAFWWWIIVVLTKLGTAEYTKNKADKKQKCLLWLILPHALRQVDADLQSATVGTKKTNNHAERRKLLQV